VAAALLLIGISFLVLKRMRRNPYLAVGWFWYFITLVPVIGLLQVGGQSMADRYTYIPLIGLFIMIVWGVAEIGTMWPRLRSVLLVVAGGALVACSYLSWVQVKFWQNDLILYSHAIETTKKNYVAYLFLGNVYMDEGKIDKAIDQYLNSMKISPTLMAFHYLGNAYYAQGKFEQANSYYFYALMISKDYPDTHYMYGRSLMKLGGVTQAIDQFNWALKIKPDYTECRTSLEEALTMRDAMPALGKP
jgi:tetratricopeptide (TPR) repeat protein